MVIASLGTLDLGRVPALPEAVELASGFGLDLSGHRTRAIGEVDLEPFDLVLGFERRHVAAAVVDGRASAERTFTLPELVELLHGLPGSAVPDDLVERARLRVQWADAARPPDFRRRPVPEVADPLSRTRPEQREAAHTLQTLVAQLARTLFG